MKKKIALLMACVMAFGVAVGGTLAWLTANTAPVVNTFTDSDINITLTETDATQGTNQLEKSFQMVPGYTITKDPKVTVKANSEDCWLFVKVEESTSPKLTDYINYTIADGWTKGNGTDIPANVYYRNVTKSNADQSFGVIGYTDTKGTAETSDDVFVADKVLVKTSVTKADMDAIDDGAAQPTLTFTAYAVQYKNSNDGNFEAKDAWKESAGYVATP